MISFMLAMPLQVVALAALVGLIVAMVLHFVFGRLHEKLEHGWCRECERCERDEHQCCAQHGHGNKHCCGFFCKIWYKLGLFIILFAQAYGLAYILERLNLLGNVADAVYMALFLGLAFTVSNLYAMVLWHHKLFFHFLLKAAHKLLILAVMAWVFVYWAGMIT